MGFLSGLADKIREEADRKFYEQWSSPSYRKSQYEEFKRLHSDKNDEELRELLLKFPIVMPNEYCDECLEYFGFTQKTSSPEEEKSLEEEIDNDSEYYQHQPSAAQEPASTEDDLEAKLAKLKNLFDKGLINQEDFDKKKSDLLINL